MTHKPSPWGEENHESSQETQDFKSYLSEKLKEQIEEENEDVKLYASLVNKAYRLGLTDMGDVFSDLLNDEKKHSDAITKIVKQLDPSFKLPWED